MNDSELAFENGFETHSPKRLWRVVADRSFGDRQIRHTNWFATNEGAQKHAEWLHSKGDKVLCVSCYVMIDYNAEGTGNKTQEHANEQADGLDGKGH